MKLLKTVLATTAIATAAGSLVAQPVDNTGDRDRYVVNAAGQILVVESPVNDQAEIIRRDGIGSEADVIGFGDTAPGIPDCPNPVNGGCGDPGVFGPVTGVGHPDMNDSGVIVSSLALTSENIDSTPSSQNARADSAIVTGTPGSLTTVARTMQTIDGMTVCSMEPMPQINASGQVFFGATIESETVGVDPGDPLCFEGAGRVRTGSGDLEYPESKAIFRFTPGGGTDLMLFASMNQSLADEVTTSDPRWVASQTTFKIIDAHLIAHSHGSVTDSGSALAFAWLTDDPNATSSNNSVNRRGLLYLDGSTVQLVALEEDDNAEIGRFASIDKAISDSDGRVVFKAEDYLDCCADNFGGASLNVWTPGGGLQNAALAETGDPVPGAAAGTVFNGFPPLQATDQFDQVAFTAGLEIPGVCDEATSGTSFADFCRGVYHVNSGGTITEVARTTAAAQANGAGASLWTDGTETFVFDSLGSVAVLGTDPGTVYFVAFDAFDVDANNNPVDPLTLEPDGPERNDHNSDVGVFVWDGGGIDKVVAEGDEIPLSSVWEQQIVLNPAQSMWERLAGALGIESAHAQTGTATVLRLFTPMPELRQHAGSRGFPIRAWLDTDGDGEADTDSMLLAAFQPPPESIPVPAMSTLAYAFLGFALMLVGLLVVRGRIF